MELKDTIEMMNSDDYKDRFKSEYMQVCIRINGLENMLDRWDVGELDFEPTCSKELLSAQLTSMYTYQAILAERARIEGIGLI